LAIKTLPRPEDASKTLFVMDGDTGVYSLYDDEGAVIDTRPLTDEELGLVNLPEIPPKIHDLADVVDQLILDALMSSMGM
jgi:hypothetical protein